MKPVPPASRRRPPAWTTLLVLLSLGGGCDAGTPRHVLLVSVDSLRADRIGVYGHARGTSPRIDRLAAGGTRFARAYAPSSWTLPSHATLLTGAAQETHGALTNGWGILADVATLAELFRTAGFRTRGVYAGPFLDPVYGFGRGFDSYESCMSEEVEGALVRRDLLSHSDVTNPCLRATVTRWAAEARPADRHFWFVHVWDVHYDYDPPREYVHRFDPTYRGPLDGRKIPGKGFPLTAAPRDVAHLLARYDGEVRFTDDSIAVMLDAFDAAGLLDDTLVVVTSDHGDEFLEHGGKGHRRTVHVESVAVPLVFHGPAVPRGLVIDRPVALADVAPTILELAGRPPVDMDGTSLAGLMRGSTDTHPPAVSVLYDPKPRNDVPVATMAIRDATSTLLTPDRGKTWVVFDPASDPAEQTPMPILDPRVREEAGGLLVSRRLPEKPFRVEPATGAAPAHLEERLRALGYVD